MEGQTGTPSAPEDPKATPPAERLGRREMMMIALALIGSGTLMIGMLSARGAETSAAGPVREASPAVKIAAVADTAPAAPAGWVENTEAWTARLRRSVAFELAARKETQVWMKVVRPLLIVRCVAGRTEAFVFTDSPAAMEAQDEDHSVRLAFDENPIRTERWPDSSAHDALFAPDGARFAAELMQARTLRFGYTPHNAAPVVAQFDVAGLGEKMAPASACRGK